MIGGEVEVSDGYLERWEEVAGADRWGNTLRFRQRLRDEFGLPFSVWVETETERRMSDSSVVVRFATDDYPVPPTSVWIGRDGRPHCTLPGPVGPATPNPIRWFRPVPKGHPDREVFVAKRDEFRAGLRRLEAVELAALAPAPAPAPAPQWFIVDLPEVAMKNPYWGVSGHETEGYTPPDARESFPEGWCCKLIQPQPATFTATDWWTVEKRQMSATGRAQFDPNWVYVQFPVHYWGVDDRNGSWFRITDQQGGGRSRRHGRPDGKNYQVECGMWIPRWLLKPVTAEQAMPVYERLVAEQEELDRATAMSAGR